MTGCNEFIHVGTMSPIDMMERRNLFESDDKSRVYVMNVDTPNSDTRSSGP